MIKRNIYQWHRTLSLVVAIPVVLWAASGFMHPIMTNIRPQIGTQQLMVVPIDTAKIKVSLRDALMVNKISSVNAIRTVAIDSVWYYQVTFPGKNEWVYLSTEDGKIRDHGDEAYAVFLAKSFLTGSDRVPVSPANAKNMHDHSDHSGMSHSGLMKDSPVKEVTLVTSFDNVYQSINRILPVYKVSFDRPDGICIYVDTGQGRFVFATNDSRRVFSNFFSLVHTWSWLEFLGKGKTVVEILFSGLAFVTAILGIWIFFTSRTMPANGNGISKARRNHRYTSIVVSLFTLMFSFSGCYHAISKISPDNRDVLLPSKELSAITLDLKKIISATDQPVTSVQLIELEGQFFWQANLQTSSNHKDLMKEMAAAASQVIYLRQNDFSVLENGDEKYARYLASAFSSRDQATITSTAYINSFDADYNFADKLLPVWRVNFTSPKNDRYYVETSSGRLSKLANDSGGYEELTFAMLHKHEFLGGFGKGVKDFSTMFWAAAQIAMVIVGIILYLKLRKRKSTKSS